MKVATIIVRDEVWCQILGLEPKDKQFLIEKLSVMVEGAFFMPKFKLGFWDGKIKFLNDDGRIYFRLLEEVVPYLDNWGYEVELRDERRAVPTIEERVDADWFIRKPEHALGVHLRPYQVGAVNAALSATSGFIISATGSGKTWMIAALADVMNRAGVRAIVIVPSSDLVEQTAATLKLGNLDIGTYSGAKKDPHHSTVVATWQALQNNPAVVKDFGCFIVDEAHGASAKTIGELINEHGKHAAYRYGFTGTFPKAKIDQMTLRGAIGEILYQVTAADLIKLGYLAQLEIEPVEIQAAVEEEFPDYGSEKTYLNRNADRLDFIADLIIARAEQYGNTLALVNSVKQGKELSKLIKNSVFLHGADDNDVRAEWYHTFDTRDDLIVIATFGIASVGISIDRIFNFMMIDAGKSFVRCIQSIGRGLRKASDKDRVHCVDVHSSLKWSKKHWKERLKYFKEAQYPVLKTVKATT
jgi:superfamily II DNA or RNA helicase